jgi:membrane protease YdiL (CAAX protease family)
VSSPFTHVAQLVRRFPLTAFTVLACLFGWLPYLLDPLIGGGSAPENIPLGPLVATIVVTCCQGREARRSWGRRLLSWRVQPAWYAVAVLVPAAVLAVSVGINALLGAPLPTGSQLAHWPQVLAGFAFMLFAVGLGEEAAWTAFAAPVLQRRHGLLGAWAVMAGIRIFWHLPLMLSGDLPWVFGLPGMLGFQAILLWMLQGDGRRWVLAATCHATLNALGGGFVFAMVSGADKARLGIVEGVVYLLVGAVCLTAALRARGAAGGVRTDVSAPSQREPLTATRPLPSAARLS